MVLFFVMILTVLMITVMITDFTRFIIPNKLNLTILLLFPVIFTCVGGRPQWYYDLAVFAGMFIFGYVVLFRFMGGGDVKLLAVCSLYAGKSSFLPFIMGVALWGGALALALLAAREFVPYIYMKLGKAPDSIPRVFTAGQPAPYGLAIAASFLCLLWWGEVAGLKL